MKKVIIKLIAFCSVFVLSLLVVSRLINHGHDNLTMDMSPATLPLVTMEWEGVPYNELHGYTTAMDVAFQRDTVTVLDENRAADFMVETYGENVTGISMEVRSADGSRLIENGQLTDYQVKEGFIEGRVALKDLIEKEEEYSLAIFLELDGSRTVSYYTRVIWSQKYAVGEKLAYIRDFHERLYNREAAQEIIQYLETDSRLEDNTSFHNVNIHSSFRQITWGDLQVTETVEPVIFLTDIASQTASFRMDYIVSASEGKDTNYYMVEEYYLIWYMPDRIYLLDYQRNMTQIPEENRMYGNDKILLGITDPDVPMIESGDGNVVVFEVAKCLFSYNVADNKLTRIFSFYDEDNADARTMYDRHSIKPLEVDNEGNVQFAVYGYMNRGRHEGEVGIQVYTYDNTLNTIEELIYMPYDKTYAVLEAQMSGLLYLNRGGLLYFKIDSMVYRVDQERKTLQRLLDITQDSSLQVSANHKIAVWVEKRDTAQSMVLNIQNFSNDSRYKVVVERNEVIRPLGFMDEDIIYGVAYTENIVRENSGRIFLPMHKVCICNAYGDLLKEYEQPGVYVTECTVADNQITLERVERLETGNYRQIDEEHIMNSMEAETGKNVVETADIDRYERYVQIKTYRAIDSKSIKIVKPKELVFEGGRVLVLPETGDKEQYYVCGSYGVEAVCLSPAEAVELAYPFYGVVLNDSGECIWRRGNRVARNQIMAIKVPEKTEAGGSLAACLDAVLKFEGVSRNSEQLLGQGKTVLEILEENLEGYQILDLTGSSLDAMLYYVNKDIPVLAQYGNGEAVLLTGFNESQVMLFEPATGRLYKKGMDDAKELLEQNGNCFITYVR